MQRVARLPGVLFRVILVTLSAPAAFAEVEWEPFVEPWGQVFPALEISLAQVSGDNETIDPAIVGEQNGLIGVMIDGVQPGTPFVLTIRIPGYAADSRLNGRIPKVEGPYQLNPLIAWDFDALAKVKQPKPLSVIYELSLGGAPAESRTSRVRMRSVNDALYYVDDDDDANDVDFNWLFAAFVNEDHPLVDQILKEALATGIIDSFSGYQSEDADEVLRQVYAIWHVLQEKGIRYSSITRTSNEHPNLHSQHVRFLDESLAMSQANCVDGSVLIASILRKVDIAPSLILVPGHMFLAFQLDAEGENYAFLETTMLGNVHDGQGQRLKALKTGLNVNVDQSSSLDSFAAALDSGQETFDAGGDKFADENDIDHQIIDIQAAREFGVMPITR
jgi:hypothetical protein